MPTKKYEVNACSNTGNEFLCPGFMIPFYKQAMSVFAANGLTGLTLNTDTTSSQYKDAQLQAQRMTVKNLFRYFCCFKHSNMDSLIFKFPFFKKD